MTDETGETPRRTVRVPDERWLQYAAVAAFEGVTVSAKLNAHMQTEIDRHEKREQTA